MIFPKPFLQIGKKIIYFHQTQDEKDELRQAALERKYHREILKQQRKEVRYLARAIPTWLAKMGHAYWYKKSEREPMKGFFNPIKINQVQISEDAYFLRVNTKRLPRGVLIAHLKDPAVLETLSHACDSQVRVYELQTGFWYSVETRYGRGNIPTMVGYAEMIRLMPPKSNPLTFPLGMGENQRPYFGDLDTVYTLLIGGSKGTGKSNEANVIICTLLTRNSPKKLRLFLTDLKGGIEFYDYGGLPHLGGDIFWLKDQSILAVSNKQKMMVRIVPSDYKPKPDDQLEPPMGQKVLTDPVEVLPVLAYCEAEMDRRARLIAPTGAKNILTYNDKFPDRQLSYWLVVIDELATMMEDPRYKKQATMSLNELARKGRAVGIYLILATQTPTSDIVPAQVGNNMDARLAFRCGNGHASGVLLGDSHFDAINIPPVQGRFIWKWGTEKVQIQAPYMAESALSQLIAEVRAGKYIDAREAELAQKADFLFKFALEYLHGECQSKRLYAMVKDQGFKQSEIYSIIDTYEVKADGTPEILLNGQLYVLTPAIQAKRIPRWLVTVADFRARRHPHPNYNYDLVTRFSLLRIRPPQVLAETQNFTAPGENNEIAPAENGKIEPSDSLPVEPVTHSANGHTAIAPLTIEPLAPAPVDDEEMPEWMREDELM